MKYAANALQINFLCSCFDMMPLRELLEGRHYVMCTLKRWGKTSGNNPLTNQRSQPCFDRFISHQVYKLILILLPFSTSECSFYRTHQFLRVSCRWSFKGLRLCFVYSISREIDMRRQSAQRAQPIQGQSIQQPVSSKEIGVIVGLVRSIDIGFSTFKEPKAVKSEMEANLSAAGELKSRIPVAAPPPEPAIAGLKALPNISVSSLKRRGGKGKTEKRIIIQQANSHY